MKFVRYLSPSVLFVLVGAAATAWAAQGDQNKPQNSAGAVPAAAVKVMPSKPSLQLAQMDAQMKAMEAMHDKMLAAKTPEERNAMSAEHEKIMQDGIAMMSGTTGTKGDMAAHHQMLDKRIDMMQSMMKMMMDRLPTSPATP